MIAVISLFFISIQSRASIEHLNYQPAMASLVGRLELQTYPGPPNFESIADGDEIERHFYLRLASSIEVSAAAKSTGIDLQEERNVRIVQLVIDADNDKLWAKLRATTGLRVRINGQLFHRFTGHHHSRVLLAVKNIENLGIK
jgi:hypothetical protein